VDIMPLALAVITDYELNAGSSVVNGTVAAKRGRRNSDPSGKTIQNEVKLCNMSCGYGALFLFQELMKSKVLYV